MVFKSKEDSYMNWERISSASKLMALMAATLMLVACETPPPPPPPPAVQAAPPPPPPPPPPATRASSIEPGGAIPETGVERSFAEGLDLYEKGEYTAAIAKLTDPAIDSAWPELRVRALKILAFSYCVSGKPALCQQAFYDAMQVDPGFNLMSAEQGHPTWGPVFEKAKVGPPDTASIASESPKRTLKRRRP